MGEWRAFTQREQSLILKLRAEGNKWKTIDELLGRGEGVCKSYIYRKGLKPDRNDPHCFRTSLDSFLFFQLAKTAAAEGVTMQEIGRRALRVYLMESP